MPRVRSQSAAITAFAFAVSFVFVTLIAMAALFFWAAGQVSSPPVFLGVLVVGTPIIFVSAAAIGAITGLCWALIPRRIRDVWMAFALTVSVLLLASLAAGGIVVSELSLQSGVLLAAIVFIGLAASALAVWINSLFAAGHTKRDR